MWVSTAPFQLGKFVRFDLDEIFNKNGTGRNINKDIAADINLIEIANKPYQKFRKLANEIINSGSKNQLSSSKIDQMIHLNKYFYLGYEIAGDHYANSGDKIKATKYYREALILDIPLSQDSIEIEKKLSKLLKIN